MDVLHFLNVLIGFSLVMLLLSIVTGFAAQTCLVFLRTKTRAVGNSLASMLEDIGSSTEEGNAGSKKNKNFARLTVNALFDKGSSFSEKKDEGVPGKIGTLYRKRVRKISQFFMAGAPKYISREEFLLLLLRKAKSENDLARKLGFENKDNASKKLDELELAMLKEETKDPKLPAQVWRTRAMNEIVPNLAAKVFARFDEAMDRITEKVSADGKKLSIMITLPLLLIYWPVDAMDLFNRLNNNPVLSAKLADIAERNVPILGEANEALLACQKEKPGSVDNKTCESEKKEFDERYNNMTTELSSVEGLFGKNVKDLDDKHVYNLSQVLNNDFKIAKPTPGMFVTWILISLGSAFWLGVLNKMLGIRSEFSKKLDEQRKVRETIQ